MDHEILRIVGQIAGIGGVALGVFLILFREVIHKRIFPKLTRRQAFWIILILLFFVWSVAIAGIAAWVCVSFQGPEDARNRQLEQRIQEIKEAKRLLEEELTRVRDRANRLAQGLTSAAWVAEMIAARDSNPEIARLASNLRRLLDDFNKAYQVDALPDWQRAIVRDAESVVEKTHSLFVYDFEDGLLSGWTARSDGDSQGCIGLSISKNRMLEGNCCLEMNMHLIGGDKEKHKGEAFVVWTKETEDGPRGTTIDVRNRMITATVLVPENSVGYVMDSIGFQLFLKSNNRDQYLYGSWTKVPRGKPTRLRLTAGLKSAEDGERSASFDPERVAEFGIKMALTTGATNVFTGKVLVDDIRWTNEK